MVVKKGIGVNMGIAIGKAYLMPEQKFVIEKKIIPKEKVKDEVARYKLAISKTKTELDALKEQVLTALGKQHAKLIDAHTMILKDPLITKDVVNLLVSKRYSAEYSLSVKIEEVLKKFEGINDAFFVERKNEIIDVSKKILLNLRNERAALIENIKEPVIIVAHNIYPADLLNIRKTANILAFCTNIGSKTSHTSIFAQNMGIPSVVGLGNITKLVQNGTYLIVDGEEGTVIIDPSEEMLERYREKKEMLDKNELYLQKIKKLPNITRDNRRITLMINLDHEDNITEYKNLNTDGIGLFRTEFLYIKGSKIPTEEEQVRVYRSVLDVNPKLPVTIRTADIGADKVQNIGIKEIINEQNPFMGFRGIRLFLKYPDLLKTQLRAIYRASHERNVSIMIPMVTNLEEILAIKELISDIKKELTREGIPYKEDIPLGIMVEVPSSAIILDLILDYIDFVSIGTNDLIQYLLAVDRVNQYVSSMYDPFHPAVVRILNLIIQTAHKKGKKVSVCGEMASDLLGSALLISLGVDVLSVNLKSYLKMKQHIRGINYENLINLSPKILSMNNSQDIKNLLAEEVL